MNGTWEQLIEEERRRRAADEEEMARRKAQREADREADREGRRRRADARRQERQQRREEAVRIMLEHPDATPYELRDLTGCSYSCICSLRASIVRRLAAALEERKAPNFGQQG